MIFKILKNRAEQALRTLAAGFVSAWSLQAIELPWGSGRLRFEKLADFEFALGARTGVLPVRLNELMQRPGVELDAELQGISKLEQRIEGIIEANQSSSLPCASAIAHLGVSVFSKDYEWRSLFAHLIEMPQDYDLFLRAALSKYQQYLRARLSTVRLVMQMKSLSPSLEMASDGDEGAGGHAKATMMFTSGGEIRPFSRDELRRLPQGEAVTLRLARGSAISLKLARHQFSLTHNREWTLVSDNGKSYTLHAGVNCVGRGRDNDVSLDADFRNVSRKHLLAQPLDNDVIVLTDISSHGTYVPPTALAS